MLPAGLLFSIVVDRVGDGVGVVVGSDDTVA
jgi:hypothetical protein